MCIDISISVKSMTAIFHAIFDMGGLLVPSSFARLDLISLTVTFNLLKMNK